MNKKILICTFFLTACAEHGVNNLNPSLYSRAGDYAYDVIDKSDCMGKIDALLFFSSGEKYTGKDDLYHYRAINATAGCTLSSFNSAMMNYCSTKGGLFYEGWCSVNGEPFFYLDRTNFTTMESGNTMTKDQWYSAALNQGFRTEKGEHLRELAREREAQAKEKEKEKIRNTKLNAEIGDLVCKEDPQRNDIYYKGYVEKITDKKVQVRITSHGGEGVYFNDIQEKPIIWSSRFGWYPCDHGEY